MKQQYKLINSKKCFCLANDIKYIYLRKFSSFHFFFRFVYSGKEHRWFWFSIWYFNTQQFFVILIKNMNGTLLADTCVVVVDDDNDGGCCY